MPHGSKSKVVRAQSFQGIAGMGLVYLPKDNQLAEILLDQLMKFPSGRYDDGVDACSAFGRLIDKVWSQAAPVPEEEPNMAVKYGDGPRTWTETNSFCQVRYLRLRVTTTRGGKYTIEPAHPSL